MEILNAMKYEYERIGIMSLPAEIYYVEEDMLSIASSYVRELSPTEALLETDARFTRGQKIRIHIIGIYEDLLKVFEINKNEDNVFGTITVNGIILDSCVIEQNSKTYCYKIIFKGLISLKAHSATGN